MVKLAQKKETELRATRADAQKIIAKADGDAKAMITMANAEAKANRIVAASLTSTLVQYKKIERWNGALSQVSGGGIPIIDLRKK